jgi:hypothetical protein
MAQNNLRIVYDNHIDDSTNTATVSSTASASTTAINLASDLKGLVWRSAQTATTVSNTKAHIKVVFTTPSTMSCIALAYTNLKVGATVQVTGYTGTAPVFSGTTDAPSFTTTGSTLVFDSGIVDVNKPAGLGQFDWGISALAPTGNEIRRGYSVVWLPIESRFPCTSVMIEITNSDNIDRYIEVSRLIMGDYWSPDYNTSFGLTAGFKDISTTERSEAGDLITSNGPQFTTLSFDLQYMTPKDKNEFNRLIKANGIKKPLFVSLFPENTDDYVKEQIHQVYGKQVQLFGITHPIFEMYSSQVEIEEI